MIEEIFYFGNKKSRIYTAIDVSQLPKNKVSIKGGQGMSLFGLFTGKQHKKQNTAEELFAQGEFLQLQNPEKAFQYYLQAANMGYPQAMYKVGQAYLFQGKGVDFSIKQSAYWYEQSAKCGFDKGMAMTAWHYMAGLGVTQSDETAKQWMQKAIETGDEKTVAIVKRELNNYESQKATVTALLKTAIEMKGIPPKEKRA